MKRKEYIIASILAIVAVLCFSSKAVFTKLAYVHNVEPITFLLLRMGMSFPIFFGVLIFLLLKMKKSEDELKLKIPLIFQIAFLGFIGYYLSSFLDVTGLQYVGASVERLILFVYPTIVLILSAIIFKSRIHKKQIIAIVVTYIGLFVMFYEGVQNIDVNNEFILGAMFVFCSAVTYASYLVGNQVLLRKMSPELFNSLAQIFSGLFVFVHYAVTHGFVLPQLPGIVYLYGFLVAFVSTIIPSYLLAYAIKKVGASQVAILGAFGPVSTIILAIIFLNERLSLYEVIGGVIIMIGVFVTIIMKAKKTKSTS